ncbi:hypothetical protein CYMTET_50321 [Cymbomonas tetramitiformis]|uniref:Uncharacterized protein n=1 Tax=Cymbomonas tetramitiformis TaxID=36881 RepID=A0AAE0BPN0_9CHLO|nr:hypothetical protein CYMTET_50321 [Cymbomonas tetramitiformis]
MQSFAELKKRLSSDRTAKLRLDSKAATLQHRVVAASRNVQQLQDEIEVLRVELNETVEAIHEKETQGQKLVEVVKLMEQELRTAEAMRLRAEESSRLQKAECQAVQTQLKRVTKELAEKDAILAEAREKSLQERGSEALDGALEFASSPYADSPLTLAMQSGRDQVLTPPSATSVSEVARDQHSAPGIAALSSATSESPTEESENRGCVLEPDWRLKGASEADSPFTSQTSQASAPTAHSGLEATSGEDNVANSRREEVASELVARLERADSTLSPLGALRSSLSPDSEKGEAITDDQETYDTAETSQFDCVGHDGSSFRGLPSDGFGGRLVDERRAETVDAEPSGSYSAFRCSPPSTGIHFNEMYADEGTYSPTHQNFRNMSAAEAAASAEKAVHAAVAALGDLRKGSGDLREEFAETLTRSTPSPGGRGRSSSPRLRIADTAPQQREENDEEGDKETPRDSPCEERPSPTYEEEQENHQPIPDANETAQEKETELAPPGKRVAFGASKAPSSDCGGTTNGRARVPLSAGQKSDRTFSRAFTSAFNPKTGGGSKNRTSSLPRSCVSIQYPTGRQLEVTTMEEVIRRGGNESPVMTRMGSL